MTEYTVNKLSSTNFFHYLYLNSILYILLKFSKNHNKIQILLNYSKNNVYL